MCNAIYTCRIIGLIFCYNRLWNTINSVKEIFNLFGNELIKTVTDCFISFLFYVYLLAIFEFKKRIRYTHEYILASNSEEIK